MLFNHRKLLIIHYSLLIIFFAFSLSAAAADDELTYSYDTGKGTASMYGTGKKEKYNVAIHITDNSLVGATIKAIRVPLEGVDKVTGLNVWLSSALKRTLVDGKYTNSPDILTQEATDSVGWVEVVLDKPYTITADGVYVGYSFNLSALNDANSKPVAVTSEKHSGGLYLFTQKTIKDWTDCSSSYGSSRLQVVLTGMTVNAASLTVDTIQYGETGKQISVPITIVNHGNNGVQSVEYTYTIGGKTVGDSVDLGADALSGTLGVTTTVNVPVEAQQHSGIYPLSFTITKVNGEANTDQSPTASTTLRIYDRLPKHRTVLEEYTGTWCQNCPRGFVALEVMNRLYPDEFIGLSYHNSDPMEVMEISEYPNEVTGYPYAYLERTYGVDPYMGFGYDDMGIEVAWKAVNALFTPANIDASAQFADGNTKIAASAQLSFPSPFDATGKAYKMEIVLVADSLHGSDESWGQVNTYSGQSFSEPEFQQFTNGGSKVYGLHFNDVVIATTRLQGTDLSLPTVEADETYTMSAEFVVDSLYSKVSGESLVQDMRNLRIVALAIDAATGQVVNACKAKVAYDPAGISTPKAYSRQTAIYDLQGRRRTNLAKGLNIVVTADGRTQKVMKK